MKCNEIESLSLLWFSGELDIARKRAFDRHVSCCPCCARFLEEQVSLDARILAALSEQPGDADTTHIERRVLLRIVAERRRRLAFAVAAAVVTLALTVGYRNRAAAPVPRVFADAARDHRVEVMEHQPRHWRSKLPEVEQLTGSFGLSAARAAELSPAGYRFARVRTCGLEGRPALHLVFTNGTHEVSLYVRRSGGSGVIQTAFVGQERMAALGTADYEAVAVSEGSTAECVQMVRKAVSML